MAILEISKFAGVDKRARNANPASAWELVNLIPTGDSLIQRGGRQVLFSIASPRTAWDAYHFLHDVGGSSEDIYVVAYDDGGQVGMSAHNSDGNKIADRAMDYKKKHCSFTAYKGRQLFIAGGFTGLWELCLAQDGYVLPFPFNPGSDIAAFRDVGFDSLTAIIQPLVTTGQTYTWRHTLYNSITGRESNPSPASMPGELGNVVIPYEYLANTAAYYDSIRLYRTGGTLTDWYLVDTIPLDSSNGAAYMAGTLTYWDPHTDSELQNAILSFDNYKPPTMEWIFYSSVHDRFFGRSLDYPNYLYFSILGRPGAIPPNNYLSFKNPLTGATVYNNEIWLFDRDGFDILTGLGPAFTGDALEFSRRRHPQSFGCLSHRAIATTETGVIWISAGGPVGSNGMQVQPVAGEYSSISDIFSSTYSDSDAADPNEDMVAVWDAKNKRYRFALNESPTASNQSEWVWENQGQAWWKTDQSILAYMLDGKSNIEAIDGTGNVYLLDVGNLDAGTKINIRYASTYLSPKPKHKPQSLIALQLLAKPDFGPRMSIVVDNEFRDANILMHEWGAITSDPTHSFGIEKYRNYRSGIAVGAAGHYFGFTITGPENDPSTIIEIKHFLVDLIKEEGELYV